MSMAMWDKKKQMQTIIQRRRGGEDAAPQMTEMKNEVIKNDAGEIDGRHLAAQDMIAALDAKSPEKLMHSLINFMDIHANGNKPEPKEG